jgi:flavin prenyltransferase
MLGAYVKLIIAITGASGIVYGKRLLEELNKNKIETHLVISEAAKKIIKLELGISVNKIAKLSTHVYDIDDWSSPIVSGSYRTDGMIIVPCSMKTLAGVANGFAENAVLRAADVMIKEKRKLIVVPRETPVSSIHLKNMLELSQQGVHIVPAMPAFYHKPQNIDGMVDFVVGRILDVLGIDHHLYKRWSETKKSS